MGSKKPHLLTEVNNNLGATTRTTYGSSTAEYLRDKRNGDTWLTRLPFPVQVVKRVEREDAISGGKLVSEYKYRHGFFDGFEREFRGFARVETTDAEDFAPEGGDPLLYQRPVRTVSWFHTGAWLEKERLEEALRKEYFPFELGGDPIVVEDSPRLEEKDPNAAEESYIPAAEVGIQDAREAARALKGAPLRQEIYALDADENPELADKPYVITEQNQQVRRLQKSRGEDLYGVFFAYARESVTVSSERKLEDPRVGHEVVLDVDRYGAVTRSASLVYGRNPAANGESEQEQHYITLSEAEFTHDVQEGSNPTLYRLGTQVESRAYEVTGINLSAAGSPLITVQELRGQLDGTTGGAVVDLDFDDDVPTTGKHRRLLDRTRQTFYNDTLTAELPHGQVGERALPYKTYQLALTTGNVALLVSESAGLAGASNQFDPTLLTGEGKYEDIESSGDYWAVSGRAEFDASNFYLPIKAIDPWGGESTVTWDTYSLLPVSATDPVGNIVQSTNDYRVLAPRLVTDPNLNRSEVEFDALGMVVATAVMGKVGSTDGDVISDPTTTLEYDLLAFQDRGEPAFVKTRAKETHGPTDSKRKFQESYAYSDGFGRVIQQKVQAEPGLAPLRHANGALQRDGGGNLVLGTVAQRWVGTGRTVFNNKGNPVKQYEPFFSSTSAYEPEDDLVDWGVTPIIRYDSIDRVVRTDLPDGTFTKVVFDSWEQLTFDQNDTVLESDWFTHPDRGAPNPAGAEPTAAGPRSAWLSAQHADTPTRVVLDSLGRPFLSVAHNRTGTGGGAVDEYYRTRTVLDIEGNTLKIFDAKQHSKTSATSHSLNPSGTYPTITQQFDVLGRRLVVDSPDAGKRVSIQDIGGKPLRSYNSRGFMSRSEFDAAQRPTHAWVKTSNADEFLVARMSYGESLDASWTDVSSNPRTGPSDDPSDPSPAQRDNLRGQVHLAFDTAGMVKTEAVDFKGNVLSASRRLTEGYKPLPHPTVSGATLPTNVDWDVLATITDPTTLESTAAPLLALEPGTTNVEVFTTTTQYDALNRVVQSTTPDGSVTTPSYNEANLLEESSVTLPTSSGGGTTRVVFGLDCNARGQRLAASHNDTGTDAPSHSLFYSYDPATFRVTEIRTERAAGGPGSKLQHLSYTYDAVGNIVEKRDDADWDPDLMSALDGGNAKYTYDALYRLVKATGREHAGQQAMDPTSAFDGEPPKGSVPHGNDLSGMRDYVEETTYDEVGNITKMRHLTGVSNGESWSRDYAYFPGTNRLEGTSVPGGVSGNTDAKYQYGTTAANNGGLHGSMTKMPHLDEMHWDFADRLQHIVKQTGGNQQAYYVYDGSGQRVRKVYQHGQVDERIYLGGVEIFRKRAAVISGPVEVERVTLHVNDDTRRVSMVETKTIDTNNDEPNSPLNQARWRYQLDNHLGSSAMEIDGSASANVISYEEFHPYGSTAFHLSSSGSEVSAKRYRYTGKEKDEESRLYYHGARYYAPWLGRWTAVDPLGVFRPGRPDLNLYAYVRGRPIVYRDPEGTDDEDGTGGAPNIEGERFGQEGAGNVPDKDKKSGRAASPDPTRSREFVTKNRRGAVAEFFGVGLDNRLVEKIARGISSVSRGNAALEKGAFSVLIERGIDKGQTGRKHIAETSPKGGVTLSKDKLDELRSYSDAQLGAKVIHEVAHSADSVSHQDTAGAEGRGYAVELFLLERAGLDVEAKRLFGAGTGEGGKDTNVAGGAFGDTVRFYATFIQNLGLLNELQRVAEGKESVLTGISREQAKQLIAQHITTDKDKRSEALKAAQDQIRENLDTVVARDKRLSYIAGYKSQGQQALESAKKVQQ